MEKQRQIKILSIVALVLAISAMTLGFSAFSTTLSISSSATVTPNSEDFKMVFSTSSSTVNTSDSTCKTVVGEGANGTTGILGSIGCVKPTSITDVVVNFTEPGQTVKYTFYVHNEGLYDAYLNKFRAGILENGSYKKCMASSSDTSDDLVEQACESISILADIDGHLTTLGKTFVDKIISPGEVQTIDLYIMYSIDAVRADGPFTVEFADVFFDYGTNIGEDIISFTIDGETFYAEEGMYWGDWVNSQYSQGMFYVTNYLIKSNSGYYVGYSNGRVTESQLIEESGVYSYTSGGVNVWS